MATQQGAVGLVPLRAATQKPDWISDKDTTKCHWMFKSHHQTNLSTHQEFYRGVDPQGGPVWTRAHWFRRLHHATEGTNNVILERTETNVWPLQSPYGQVPNHNGVGGSPTHWATIGPDYNVPSEDYLQKMQAIAGDLLSHNSSSDFDGLYTRVVGAKHDFFFTNYMRYPVQVLFVYSGDPTGSSTNPETPMKLMEELSRDAWDVKVTGGNNMDPDALERIQASAESVIIPGTQDNGDMGVTAKHTIKFSPKEFNEDIFAIGPQQGTTMTGGGLWRKVIAGRYSAGQNPPDSDDTGGSLTRLSAWSDESPDWHKGSHIDTPAFVQIFMRIITPHGHVVGDEQTTPTAMRAGNTMENYRAVDIHVKSDFINEVIGMGIVRRRFNGVQSNFRNANASS